MGQRGNDGDRVSWNAAETNVILPVALRACLEWDLSPFLEHY